MKPVGSRLNNREVIGEGFTWLDACKADAWYTILLEWKNQSVPMNGRHLVQIIGNVNRDFFAFLETQHRPR